MSIEQSEIIERLHDKCTDLQIEIDRLREQNVAMQDVLFAIDNVNARRANVLLQDQHFRIPYEQTLGHCLDRVRRITEAMNQGKPIPKWKGEV